LPLGYLQGGVEGNIETHERERGVFGFQGVRLVVSFPCRFSRRGRCRCVRTDGRRSLFRTPVRTDAHHNLYASANHRIKIVYPSLLVPDL